MTFDRCFFIFLRYSVNGKHLSVLKVKTLFLNSLGVVWTGPGSVEQRRDPALETTKTTRFI